MSQLWESVKPALKGYLTASVLHRAGSVLTPLALSPL